MIGFIGAVLFLPQIGSANTSQISLSQTDTWLLLNKVQSQISEKMLVDLDSFEPEEQAAIFLVRKSIRKEFFDFCLSKLTKDISKAYLKALLFLYATPDIDAVLKDIFNKLESESRKAALEELENWLNQNEIKTASGELNFSYEDHNRIQQNANFRYVMVYRPLRDNRAELGIDFYSRNQLSPPPATWETPWDIYTFLDRRETKINPFIVQVKTGVVKTDTGYQYDPTSQTEIKVSFPEEVPNLQPEKTSFLD
ncbi:MAG: hypothetical protein COV63_01190, partial [Candidatus Nealsonbacteria bacterium CG11_big_fil_rev_8_21_14_0_20_37_68]